MTNNAIIIKGISYYIVLLIKFTNQYTRPLFNTNLGL